MWGLFLSRPSCCWFWTRLGFHPHSIKTPEFDTSLCEPDAITSSVSSGFLHSVHTISYTLNHNLLLALGVVSSGARLGPFLHLCLWIPRCQHLNWFATSLATLQPLGSSLLHHQITSPWLLPIGRLIIVYQPFILALELLLMPLLTWSNWFFISELPLLILFPLYHILRKELSLCPKGMTYLSRFMTFWTMLCPYEFGTQLLF